MKRIFVITFITLLLVAGKSFSQTTPVADERQQAQRARIREGTASGEITRPERARLKAEQRQIRRTERRAKADGTVTTRERAKISRKQNKASRDIRRQKHDGQERGN